jgi:uncharacterized protein YycO
MYAAFYKGKSPGLAGVFDKLDHIWEEGRYSHVELVFSDGKNASAILDGGVRFEDAGVENFSDPTLWTIVDCSMFSEDDARNWFTEHNGLPYDLEGDIHFVLGFVHHQADHYFCSAAVGTALGFDQAWRFDPNALYIVLARIHEMSKVK